jgi:hypothetical protein
MSNGKDSGTTNGGPAIDTASSPSFRRPITNATTYSAQHKLPHLPIPTLQETMAKFPKVLESLQSKEQQEETKRECDEFLKTDGPILQQLLIEYEQEGFQKGEIGSYVEEFWNESYLSPDTSVVLNLNPFFGECVDFGHDRLAVAHAFSRSFF